MIHVVTARNRALYSRQLQEMFALRKQLLVDGLGWQLKVINGGEVDDYDDEQMIYFLALNAEGEIDVAIRARPTLDRSMLTDVFPHLLAEDWPNIQVEGVWETSRQFKSPRYKSSGGRGRFGELIIGQCEYAFDHGVTRLVGLVDVRVWPMMEQLPWSARWTGLPAEYREGVAVGVEMKNTADELFLNRERAALMNRVAFDVHPRDVFAHLPTVQVEALFQTAVEQGLDLDREELRTQMTRLFLAGELAELAA